MYKLTPTDYLILQQAIDDGGAVVLTGIDMHEGWTRRHLNRAYRLARLGLGEVRLVGFLEHEFKIGDAGKRALADRKK